MGCLHSIWVGMVRLILCGMLIIVFFDAGFSMPPKKKASPSLTSFMKDAMNEEAALKKDQQPSNQKLPMASVPPALPSIKAPIPAKTPGVVEQIGKIGVQGNWVKKREWLIKAHEVNNEIQDLSASVEDTRKKFIERHNDVDVILNAYYKALGLEHGKVQGLFDSINRYIEKKKKREIKQLTVQGEDLRTSDFQARVEIVESALHDLRQQLEQLKLDMQSVEDLDRSLVERLKRLDEYMEIIKKDAKNAKDITKEFWEIIDHNKARSRYYELENTIKEKIKVNLLYLQNDLFNDFESVIGTIKSQIDQAKSQIKKLEAEGLFVKNRSKRIKELKLHELEMKRKEVEEHRKLEAGKKVKPSELEHLTWSQRFHNVFKAVTSPFFVGWEWLKSKFTGAKVSSVETKGREVSKQPEKKQKSIELVPQPEKESNSQMGNDTMSSV